MSHGRSLILRFHYDAPIVDRHGVGPTPWKHFNADIVPISVPIQGRDAPLEKVVRNRVDTVFVPIRLCFYCNPFYI